VECCAAASRPLNGYKLCDPPLFFPGDELLKGSGDGGFLSRFSTYAEGMIKQLLVESKIRGHV
jgi:hypothetical protein